LTSGLFAVVVIADDLQAGHLEGLAAVPLELDPVPMLLRESNVTRLSIDLPHNFPCGHLQLCGDGDLVPARHTRRAAARELPRTKTSQHCELERGEFSWTLYHHPSQQGFGEGWAGMAEGSEKQEAPLYA
jgi:hypothetical protein